MNDNMHNGMLDHTHAQDIVMVCVTRQKTCARLIEAGDAIAREHELPLHVVHAVTTGENFLGGDYDAETLEFLFTAAQLYDASLSVLRADDALQALRDYARVHAARYMVLGPSPKNSEAAGAAFADSMQRLLPELTIVIA
ncbi:hypothetical protein LJC07_05655 [Christensenellaceae bacterium OttesenSCG-928-L17]|nr:hypothetical protein [Christensenellaceae bacterium OttesenSCG-928-L17]